jgi:hypothetical protein
MGAVVHFLEYSGKILHMFLWFYLMSEETNIPLAEV